MHQLLRRPLVCVGSRKAESLLRKGDVKTPAIEVDIEDLIEDDFDRVSIILHREGFFRLLMTRKHALKRSMERLLVHAHGL